LYTEQINLLWVKNNATARRGQMSRIKRFSRVTNYVLYYGLGREKDISRFDLAIVEPAGQTKESIEVVKSSGTLLLAYISIMELALWEKELKLLEKDDFIHHQGEPLINSFNNYVLDIRSDRWKNIIMERAENLLHHHRYDGLFLDTIGDIEWAGFTCETGDSLLLAAANIVKDLRDQFPDYLLLQNNGFNRLFDYTARHIDGICWENPVFSDESYALWSQAILEKLSWYQIKEGIKIFLLLEECSSDQENKSLVKKIAQTRKYLLYLAPVGYVEGINDYFTG
jgi:endo-alpha-1,4-polygalactosaminidase (GH114 family)